MIVVLLAHAFRESTAEMPGATGDVTSRVSCEGKTLCKLSRFKGSETRWVLLPRFPHLRVGCDALAGDLVRIYTAIKASVPVLDGVENSA